MIFYLKEGPLMRRTQFWILALFAVVFLVPATFCSATNAKTAYSNDAQVATIAPDALTATGTSTAVAVSETIISSSTDIACEAAGGVDQFAATTSKTYAENELTTNNETAEESSWIAKQTIAVTVGSEGRANATFLSANLAPVLSNTFSGNENPLASTSASQEAQGRANAQTDAALTTDTKTAADASEQNANTATNLPYLKTSEYSIPMSTTADTCDDFAATAEQNTDVANSTNGQYVGTMAQIALTTNAAWQGRYHVIKPNFNGMTRA